MSRLLPRRGAIAIMAGNTADLAQPASAAPVVSPAARAPGAAAPSPSAILPTDQPRTKDAS
jgi:hypothetical protein